MRLITERARRLDGKRLVFRAKRVVERQFFDDPMKGYAATPFARRGLEQLEHAIDLSIVRRAEALVTFLL